MSQIGFGYTYLDTILGAPKDYNDYGDITVHG